MEKTFLFARRQFHHLDLFNYNVVAGKNHRHLLIFYRIKFKNPKILVKNFKVRKKNNFLFIFRQSIMKNPHDRSMRSFANGHMWT
jgi:hypothetical protein